MDMYVKDTLDALGLNDEATVSPRTGVCYLNTVRRAGDPIGAPSRGPGTTHGRFSTPTLWADTPVSGGGGADRF